MAKKGEPIHLFLCLYLLKVHHFFTRESIAHRWSEHWYIYFCTHHQSGILSLCFVFFIFFCGSWSKVKPKGLQCIYSVSDTKSLARDSRLFKHRTKVDKCIGIPARNLATRNARTGFLATVGVYPGRFVWFHIMCCARIGSLFPQPKKGFHGYRWMIPYLEQSIGIYRFDIILL